MDYIEVPQPPAKPRKRLRFRSVVSLANRKLPVRFAAIVLASSTLVSALLGIFRDRLLNSYYLDTYPTGIDAYTGFFVFLAHFRSFSRQFYSRFQSTPHHWQQKIRLGTQLQPTQSYGNLNPHRLHRHHHLR